MENKENQRQVKLIGFRAENHRVIKAINLTPDLFNQKLIQVVGDIGNGKSTLIEMLQTALSGSDAIKKKDVLEKGYLTEVQLIDGDVKLYAGAKVTEYTRGKNTGDSKFEIFLYCKDKDGKTYTPVIDGQKATASDYAKMLTTELTFNMPDLFSSNATVHRKLIEKLFSKEISNLGIEELSERIEKAKELRDSARNICDANGAFMDSFKEEGFKKDDLLALDLINIEDIDSDIAKKNIEKGNLTASFEKDQEVAEAQFEMKKTTTLADLKESGRKVTEKIKAMTDEKIREYSNIKETNDTRAATLVKFSGELSKLESVLLYLSIPDEDKLEIKNLAISKYDNLAETLQLGVKIPNEDPKVIPFVDGKINIPEVYHEDYNPLIEERRLILVEYAKE